MTSNSTPDAQMCIRDWLNMARPKLAEKLARLPAGQMFSPPGPEVDELLHSASLEALLLVGHVLDCSRAWVIAHSETRLPREQEERLDDLLSRRLSGEPLPYLLGHWEFYGLDFDVTPNVLIPRPETELLVERALTFLRHRPGCRAGDTGTGSGCIAVSLLKYVPALHIIATDLSLPALRVARRNAVRHAVLPRLTLVQTDLMSAVAGALDLVCANLPYIPRKALEALPVARHEPITALDGGAEGLDVIRRLIQDAPRWLAPGGRLLLEIQFDQGEAVQSLAKQYLSGASTEVLPDLAGKPRLVEVKI
jgi:release factor glutamine methyltransferase